MIVIIMVDNEILKSVITVSVEKALLEMGVLELDLVKSKLKEDHNCEISDCLEHPEYLKEILCELYGNSHEVVLKSIHESLRRTAMEEPLENFLTVLECNC